MDIKVDLYYPLFYTFVSNKHTSITCKLGCVKGDVFSNLVPWDSSPYKPPFRGIFLGHFFPRFQQSQIQRLQGVKRLMLHTYVSVPWEGNSHKLELWAPTYTPPKTTATCPLKKSWLEDYNYFPFKMAPFYGRHSLVFQGCNWIPGALLVTGCCNPPWMKRFAASVAIFPSEALKCLTACPHSGDSQPKTPKKQCCLVVFGYCLVRCCGWFGDDFIMI